MSDLPYGMREDVEIEITISGTASEVLAELRGVRPGKTSRKASVEVKVVRSDNRRFWESQTLPAIVEGDASRAQRTLENLVRQGLIEPDTERRLGAALAAVETLTRRAE
jgi:hypothetical protein